MTTEAETAVRHLKEIQDFFAAMADGTTRARYGHLTRAVLESVGRPTLIVNNTRGAT